MWTLPDKTISVIGQCKKETKPCGSKYIRELEGVISSRQENEQLELLLAKMNSTLSASGRNSDRNDNDNNNNNSNNDKNDSVSNSVDSSNSNRNSLLGIFMSYSGYTTHAMRQFMQGRLIIYNL